jgi:hypothetical protein
MQAFERRKPSFIILKSKEEIDYPKLHGAGIPKQSITQTLSPTNKIAPWNRLQNFKYQSVIKGIPSKAAYVKRFITKSTLSSPLHYPMTVRLVLSHVAAML